MIIIILILYPYAYFMKIINIKLIANTVYLHNNRKIIIPMLVMVQDTLIACRGIALIWL